ncbi:MAG: hypothetical protein R3C10_23785 [Pirellulales bacterium]
MLKPMGKGNYGYYLDEGCGGRRGIYVNSDMLEDRAECVNTVVHEGRHAYQLRAMDLGDKFHPQLRTNEELQAEGVRSFANRDSEILAPHRDVEAWQNNDWRDPGNYKNSGETIEEQKLYATQWAERDSGAFGFAVTQAVYPDYKPSPERIDQYNAGNASQKYGGVITRQRQETSIQRPDALSRIDRRPPEGRMTPQRLEQHERDKVTAKTIGPGNPGGSSINRRGEQIAQKPSPDSVKTEPAKPAANCSATEPSERSRQTPAKRKPPRI